MSARVAVFHTIMALHRISERVAARIDVAAIPDDVILYAACKKARVALVRHTSCRYPPGFCHVALQTLCCHICYPSAPALSRRYRPVPDRGWQERHHGACCRCRAYGRRLLDQLSFVSNKGSGTAPWNGPWLLHGFTILVLICSLQGYANPGQTARGLHTRLYARAFIFAQADDPQ